MSVNKVGVASIPFLLKMTPAYLNAITTASEEIDAKRRVTQMTFWRILFTFRRSPHSGCSGSSWFIKGADFGCSQYCMLDSGANVSVIPWKPGMKGEKTMCTLVGENKTEGLIVSRLYTH